MEPQQQGPFDGQRFFNPNNPNLPSNPNLPYPPPSTAASYPPPTVTGAGVGYPYPQPPLFHHQYQPQYENSNPNPNPNPNLSNVNLQHQRSVPYPTPSLQPPANQHGARLMALLSAPMATSVESANMVPSMMTSALVSAGGVGGSGPMRMASSKMPKGRHLVGEKVAYDIDVRLGGEVQPQLEVTPITKYGSDPELLVGRQIAVNKTYICYGLRLGAIRTLNSSTASRALLKGLHQRVTDMAFFAEDVDLLAGASIDGRVFVWKITEGKDEDDKPQIIGNIVIALQIEVESESVHPRVCWHCHKQEVLVVGIGKHVLRIDTTKVGRGEVYSAEEPLKFSIDKLVNGVQFVGSHDGEVTDLSMCQWMTTRLVSASVDGTIKIWEDRKSSPIAVLRPHNGHPVNSVTFLTAPHRPDHIILITGGPLNREMKIWVSDSEEGWLLPSDADSWRCLQTLELKSSSEPRVEDAFFNQVVALPQTGLLLLANAKKNAIYVVHLEYGPNPEATHMDYIAEFTVTMPILSFVGTSDILAHGDQIVQVYCVQTQAIQQYALDVSQCLPPPFDTVAYERQDSALSYEPPSTEGLNVLEPPRSNAEIPLAVSVPSSDPGSFSRQPSSSSLAEGSMLKESPAPILESPPVVASPTLSRKPSDLQSPIGVHESSEPRIVDYQVDRQAETADLVTDSNKVLKEDGTMFKHPTHLVTPAELMATTSTEINHATEQKSEVDSSVQDVIINPDQQNVELEVKEVGEIGKSQNVGGYISEQKEKSFSSQASGFGFEMGKDRNLGVSVESRTSTLVEQDEVQHANFDLPSVSAIPATVDSPASVSSTKGKKHKGTNGQESTPSSPPSQSIYNSTDSHNEAGIVSSVPSGDEILSQLRSVQEIVVQVLTSQKEMQKQILTMVATTVTKEVRKIEAAIGKNMEKTYKANSDAVWARTQEEFAKQEKSNRERHQQVSTLVTNGNKDILATFEKMLKKETSALVASLVRSITPVIEKTVSTMIAEAFQRGVADKSVNQLEKSVNSKLEGSIARQIQTQFQTSGKQALQEALKSSMEASVVPAFEMSCKAMFDQVNATFQKGMVEHTSAAHQQVESAHSPLAIALRDAINSASSMTQSLSGELADGQRKLVALALAGANSESVNPLVTQLSNGPIGSFHDKMEAPLDPTKELSRLVYEHKYEEAFTAALQRSDVWIVSWLCSQVDLQGLLTSNPLPLSQGVLLSLLQQLACDIGNDTSKKLAWMMDVVVAIKPSDSMIAMHVRPIFEQVKSILNHQVSIPTTSVAERSSIKIVMKLISSTLGTL